MSRTQRRKLNIGDTATGFPPHEDAVIREAINQFRDLLCANYPFIREVREQSDNGQVSFGFRCTMNHAGKTPVVSSRLSFSRAWSDEAESKLEDPDQAQLPIDPNGGGE